MSIADMIAGIVGLDRLGRPAKIAASAIAIAWAWGLHWLGGFPLFAIACLIGAAKVAWAAPRADVPLIADRLVGQWIALTPLSAGLWFAGAAPHVFPYPGWLGAFILFNLFVRYPPIARLGARAPLLDDAVAGVAAAIVTLAAAAVSHGWLV